MSNYLRKTEKTGKSIDEAIEAALAELNITRENAEIEILDEGSKGFLGIGAKEASVRVSEKNTDDLVCREFLNSIFDAMKLDVNIDIKSTDDAVNIDLSGEHMGIIIGKRGDTLDSLQYLTSLVINNKNEKYKKVTIDTENYREKRNEALVALAGRLEKKVEKSGKKYTLEPMNPYERRIIHASLQDSTVVTTYSIGEDPFRKVVIALKDGQKPAFKKIDKDKRGSNGEIRTRRKPSAPSRPTAPAKSEVPDGAFIDYANYAKERAARPKVTKAKAGSFDEYLANQENSQKESE